MTPVEKYLTLGLPSVEGWLHPFSAEFIESIGSFQVSQGHSGSVGEIGVHHGKLFILLSLLAVPAERRFCIDVFEDQALNLDNSGRGDRAQFLRNLRRWDGRVDNVEIMAKSSLDVTPQELLAAAGPVRLFSIDGGHTEECIRNDLTLAENVLAPHGVAIVDDCFNQSWPSVASGVAHYLTHAPRLVPIAISPNKLYLSRTERADSYRSALRRLNPRTYESTAHYFGHDVDVYGCAAPTPATTLKHLLKQTRLGARLLAVKRSVDALARNRSNRPLAGMPNDAV